MSLLSKDYLVKGVLGEGSFSKVFKIEHKVSGIQFAGKHLKRVFRRKQDLINCTEINVMKRIEDHPNILNLKDLICDSFPCNIILVVELMDMNLYEFLRDKQTSLSESLSRIFFYQIVCGIQHLHKNGVFHRDVKPENILLKFPKTANGISQEYKLATVKLADFGSVKSTDTEFPLTMYVATRWYRAPECLITDGFYGPKMDIWSAGCIFYEMLTLQPLFPGDSELDQLDKIHKILGSPTESILRRFRHLKVNFEFSKVDSVKLSTLVPKLSKLGLNVLNMCLSYLPETRIDSKRLMDHYYFSDVRHSVPLSARRCNSGPKSARLPLLSTSGLILPKKVISDSPIKPRRLTQKRRDTNDSDKTVATKPKRQRKQN